MEIANLVLEYLKVLVWPVTVLVAMLLFQKDLHSLFAWLKKADLPGGIAIETFDAQLQEAKIVSQTVEAQIKGDTENKAVIPLKDVNQRMLELGLAPSPSGLDVSFYRNLSKQDPNLGLAGLRIELEQMLRNVAQGFKVGIDGKLSITQILNVIYSQAAITGEQHDLLLRVIRICNMAIHGQKVTRSQADEVYDIAEVLKAQYLAWLSWGFESSEKVIDGV